MIINVYNIYIYNDYIHLPGRCKHIQHSTQGCQVHYDS